MDKFSAESGTRHISGTGGQLDFLSLQVSELRAQSYRTSFSTYTDKKGTTFEYQIYVYWWRHNYGSTKSAYTMVTEYGIENLAGASVWERAES